MDNLDLPQRIIVSGKVMGGHTMTSTLLPSLVNGTPIGLHFNGTADYPERITATTPDGQFAGTSTIHLQSRFTQIDIGL